MTVGQHGGMTVPLGPGMGPTQAACVVESPARAAGRLLIMTVDEPIAISPGPPGRHPGMEHGAVVLLTVAAGMLEIITVAEPLTMARGIGGCGAGVGVGAAGCIGAWQCGADCSTLSPTRAAGGIGVGSVA